MSEVHDPHDAEDESQPDAEESVRPPQDQGVHEMLQELIQAAGPFIETESCAESSAEFLAIPVQVISGLG
ncbi:MAG: hypothetical protein O6944_06025 [Gammaproteobacteria bacterium]|nr:hypothetical protein [Gammaproteobacteria bacterium]